MHEVKITIRTSFDAENREQRQEIVVDAAKKFAKEMLATVALISDKRKPQIMIEAGESMFGTEEIELMGDDGETPGE